MILAIGATAIVTSAQPAAADPSPYCRPSIGTPYISTQPQYQGNGEYTLTVTVQISMNCNGAIYSSLVAPLLHYSVDGVGHIASGSNKTCTSSCTATAHITHTFECYDPHTVSYYGQISGWWKRYSSSTQAPLSGNGLTYDDEFIDGNGVCP